MKKRRAPMLALVCLMTSLTTACEREDPNLTAAKAVYAGDIKAVRTALDHGVSPNAMVDGRRLLWIAFEGRDGYAMSVVLMKHGADVNGRNAGGVTALMAAVHASQLEGVAFLLQRGADPNLEDDNGETCLFDLGYGAFQVEITRLLLAAGVDPCHKDKDGKTAEQHLDEASPSRTLIAEACHVSGR